MFSFNNLDLTNVVVNKTLPEGVFVCETSDAKLVESGGNWQVTIRLSDVGGKGSITDRFWMTHTNTKAVEAGQSRLKSMMEFGGHLNPNKPESISSLNGLKVAIRVTSDGQYTNVGKYMSPKDVLVSSPEGGNSTGEKPLF